MAVLRSLGGVGVGGDRHCHRRWKRSDNCDLRGTKGGSAHFGANLQEVRGNRRVLYAIPSDREFRAESSETIAHFIVDLQSWYRRELGGLTFSIYEVIPEVCRMSGTADSYARGNAWENVVAGVQHCGSVQHDHPDFVWVVYVDLMEPCDESHELGAGGAGLTIMGAAEGSFDPGWFYYCGEGPYNAEFEDFIGTRARAGPYAGLPAPAGM